MTLARRERLSVSVSVQAKQYVRRAAQGRSKSAVVDEALRRMETEERRRLTQNTLVAESHEDAALAEEWMTAAPALE